MDGDTESYVLLLLSDGNLPTGSFVASSGLEAYVKHGFFALSSPSTAPPAKTAATINFLRDSVQSYARSTLSFISAIYEVCVRLQQHDGGGSSPLGVDAALRSVTTLDDLYESTTLNHVARRASTTQGVALLTLLTRGLVQPSWVEGEDLGRKRIETLADTLKLEIRRGSVHGHLPICWAVLTAALGLSCGALFTFLWCRGNPLLSYVS